jgi:hypothetical protein
MDESMTQSIALFASIIVIASLFQGKGRKVVLWIAGASLCLVVIYAGIYLLDYVATKRAAGQVQERSRQEKLSKVEAKLFSPVIAIYNGETLRVMPVPKRPPDAVAVVYLGHHQKVKFVCGDFDEKPQRPETDGNGLTSCP